LAGPTVARTLAEHGADVLHIASPALPTIDMFEMDTGHGKRQASLMARITIDEQGKVDPPGAAYVEITPRPTEHVNAGPHKLPTNASVATVQYQCRRCDRSFWAIVGRVTVHDC
jgi:hypothetical protein